MRRTVLIAVVWFLCALTAFHTHEPLAQTSEPAERAAFDLDDPIPFDPDITVGELANGLRYYIKVNVKPEKRAQLWLAVNAGSILEDGDQRGLAHFVEHMAFNGTAHFAKQELIDYLESIGMKFGADVNAYTSFDQTVYKLRVPTDSVQLVEDGFQILEDWAHGITFDPEEIDKERGVIIEEWRLGLGANRRMLDKQLPILFKGSRYAERLPIGKMEVVEHCDRGTLLRFYRDWYRPDMMAVIAVGDFDRDWIESLIEKHFSRLLAAADVRERAVYPVPDHEETLFAIATDPEATGTSINVCYKSDPLPVETVADYRRGLLKRLNSVLFNFRLYELKEQADPPFINAGSRKGSFVRSKDVYMLGASVEEDGVERGLEALQTEASRVRKYGFTESELDRAKARILMMTEKWYDERDKIRSRMYVGKILSHFLENDPLPGTANDLALCRQLLPTITVDEVNQLLDQWITDDNRVILLSAPEKEEVGVPTEEELLAVFEAVDRREIEAYVDEVSDAPLLGEEPQPGDIVDERTIEELGVTEWVLSNGVRVVLKPTDFDYENISVRAFSPGGHSLVSDEEYLAAEHVGWIVQQSGIGEFSRSDLRKKLAGKNAKVLSYISTLSEGLSGSSFSKDAEILFQLIYLYMTSPRENEDAFSSYITRMKGRIENRSASPERAFQDTVGVTLAQYHYRSLPLTEEKLSDIDLGTAFRIYRERFGDASDFTFIIVGYFDIDEIRPLVRTYLGGLPALHRDENWKDLGIEPPAGIVKKYVRKGMEEKSRVRIVFSGPCEWSSEKDHVLTSMAQVMNIKLREILREDMSGTYSARASATMKQYPREEYRVTISFGCAPDRVEELVQTVFAQIDSLQVAGPDESCIAKVREIQRRRYETALKASSYWKRKLYQAYYNKEDPKTLLEYPELVEALSVRAVRDAARKYFDTNNYVRVVLLPEEETE